MRDFSFRFITGAIVAFVFLYIFTLKGGEALIAAGVKRTLVQAVIVDPEEILSGEVRYGDLVYDHVREALTGDWIRALAGLGVDLDIVVRSKQGYIFYPSRRDWFSQDALTFPGEIAPPTPFSLLETPEPEGQGADALARQNYQLMRQGLVLDVRTRIGNNTWLANGILMVYLFALLQVLWLHARRFILRAEHEKLELAHRLERESGERVSRIEGELGRVRSKLGEASRHAGERVGQIRALQTEKEKLEKRLGGWSWEDAAELEKEIESLELQLKEAASEKKTREETIRNLNESIQKREARALPRGKAREAEILERRLKTLYKNLEFEHRVVADFINLGDDEAMLRAEEIIKRLNDRDDNLPVRRKVGGLERGNIFELGFGFKGRIYYCHGEGGRMRIILVGAKNTQDKDLSYLRRYR
jgi:regulator of replication initiation timing